jgi:SAM-dependent methyltransferase
MGGGASKDTTSTSTSKKKKGDEEEIIRRPPLTMAEEVLGSLEAKRKVASAIEEVPPGEANRWSTLLMVINRETEPTEEEPDPLRVNINTKELKIILKTNYDNIATAHSDGIVLMREHYPTLYKEHSFEKAKRQSQVERNEKKLHEDMWAYGELDHEVFATIYEKVSKAYGVRKNGIFYDVGCGVGQLVYTAAFIGDFKECNGIDMITPLLETGERKARQWNKIKTKFPEAMRLIKFHWMCENFLVNDDWVDGTFIIFHWTALNPQQIKLMAEKIDYCEEGTISISFTHPMPNPNMELLVADTCQLSWGETDFFVQMKSTPAKLRNKPKKSEKAMAFM